MAKKVTYEEDWWLDSLLFTQDEENLSDQNIAHEPDENNLGEEMSVCANVASADITALEPNQTTLGGEKSVVPNIATNKQYVEELDVGLIGGHNSGPKEVDERSGRPRKKAKFVITENQGTTCNQVNDRALAERERRKQMAAMFKDLRFLLPQFSSKVPYATILEEAMSTIKSLEETCDSLEKHRQERLSNETRVAPPVPSDTRVIENDASRMNKDAITGPRSDFMKSWCTPNVSLHVFGANACVNICSVINNDSFFTSICYILSKHNVDVRSFRIYSDHAKTMYSVSLSVNAPIEVVNIFPYEDLFKLVAAEINYVYGQILEAPRLKKTV